MMHGNVLVEESLAEVARAGARIFADAAHATPGAFRVALAGGRTPRALYELLASGAQTTTGAGGANVAGGIAWSRVMAALGDERCVPPDHPDSNYRMVRESGFADLPGITVARVPTEKPPAEAARAYSALVAERFFQSAADAPAPAFDLVLLGMGPDGHTASLFPHASTLVETGRWFVEVPPAGSPLCPRVTMTLPLLCAARDVVILITGADKRNTVERVRAAEANPSSAAIAELPILGVRPTGKLTWILDEAAAR